MKRERGSHRVLEKSGFADYVFAFHDNEEIGPRMLSRIARHTGLTPDDLWRSAVAAELVAAADRGSLREHVAAELQESLGGRRVSVTIPAGSHGGETRGQRAQRELGLVGRDDNVQWEFRWAEGLSWLTEAGLVAGAVLAIVGGMRWLVRRGRSA